MTPTEVSSDLGMPLTTASDAIRRLVERGLVQRLPTPGDRRSFRIELTSAGFREWQRGWPALRRVNDVIAQHLTIDADAARDVLEHLDEAMQRALTEA
jgi:DNA-binding MarR family transcriptional regulator